jgi:hypothetical protein
LAQFCSSRVSIRGQLPKQITHERRLLDVNVQSELSLITLGRAPQKRKLSVKKVL